MTNLPESHWHADPIGFQWEREDALKVTYASAAQGQNPRLMNQEWDKDAGQVWETGEG